MIIDNLGTISFFFAIITLTITTSIFFNRISTTQKILLKLSEKIVKNQEKYHIKADLFYQEAENNAQILKEESIRQNRSHSSNNAMLGNIISLQKTHEIEQKYMKDLFSEIKQLQINTNEAINNNTNVLTELLFHIKETR
jgi:ketol-acid reductoisomerase